MVAIRLYVHALSVSEFFKASNGILQDNVINPERDFRNDRITYPRPWR